MIKYGTIEYFTLESLRDKLRGHKYDKLDLLFLDKLKMEIDLKIKAIHYEHTESLQKRVEKSGRSSTILQD